MGSEWVRYSVDDFAEIVGGGTPSTKNETYWNGTIPWLTPKDLSSYSYRYIEKGERSISKQGLIHSSAKIIPQNSILLTTRAPVGYLAIAKNSICTNQGFRSLIVKEGFDTLFIYYLLKNNIDYLQQNASGTTFQELSGSTLKSLEFLIPPIEEQKRIAHILGTLDDKIELNHRMNETLEAMARALFKAWFVDFEPVKAKMNGEPYPLPDEIMDLFPDELVESELGMIPKGWRVGKLGDFGKIVCGKTPSKNNKEYFGGVIPFIKIPDMHNQIFITETGDSLTKQGADSQHKKYLSPFTIIVSCIATVGLVSITTRECQTNQQINAIIPANNHYCCYLYFSIKVMADYLKMLGSAGSATLNVNTSQFAKVKCLIPPKDVLSSFDKLIHPIFDYILNNEVNFASAGLRDSLLRLFFG